MHVSENQIFNLMDTNGRRSDVVNSLYIYLTCLKNTYTELGTTEWKTFPTQTTQFVFYQKAIEASSDVFRRHPGYDRIIDELETHHIMDAFLACDRLTVDRVLGDDAADFYRDLDISVQKRARDYTNNLVKIGFTDESRQITEVGRTALGESAVIRDEVEQILPIDDTNILYLRQLLKLRIFCNDGSGRFCSPVLMAVYLLLKYPQISRTDFTNLVQTLSPYRPIADIDEYIEKYFENGQTEPAENLPPEFNTANELSDDTLSNYFTNARSAQSVNIYLRFYHLLYRFVSLKNQASLDSLLQFWSEHKPVLNTAFGYGRAIFTTSRTINDIDTFLDKNDHLLFLSDITTFNKELYHRFQSSKIYDGCREYFDTTMRLLSVTGVFKFKNGLVELAYPEVFSVLFEHLNINASVFGYVAPDYMAAENEYFTSSKSLTDILCLTTREIHQLLESLMDIYNVRSIDEISIVLSNQRQQDFRTFIQSEYPKERTIYLLSLFVDEQNHRTIREEVNPSATVPTIFEYIIGISWYYLSDENFDLLNSLNLSLDADFLPVTHAGGGEGDIIINYGECVVMLEATLMNQDAQRRNEWEPVLRHTINLKAECAPMDELTFFCADHLDPNTINIWRAVSLVELTTTNGTNIPVKHIKVMPISVEELIVFLQQDISATSLIEHAQNSYSDFEESIVTLDSNWRENFIRAVMNQQTE